MIISELIEKIGMKNNIVLHITKDFIRCEKVFSTSVECYNYLKDNKLLCLIVKNIDIFYTTGIYKAYSAFIIECYE